MKTKRYRGLLRLGAALLVVMLTLAMGQLALAVHNLGVFELDRNAIDESMDRCDVVDLADRPISRLSGGERQRALIARALAQRQSGGGDDRGERRGDSLCRAGLGRLEGLGGVLVPNYATQQGGAIRYQTIAADVQLAPLDVGLDAAVLRPPPLGNVEFRQNLHTGENGPQ